MIEYGVTQRNSDQVFHMKTLNDAVEVWKGQGDPNQWLVVERWTSPWEEVE